MSVIVVTAAVAAGLFAIFGPLWPPRDLSATFTPEMLEWLQMIDSTAQRRAHQVALLFLLFGSLIGLWVYGRRPQWLGTRASALAKPLHAVCRPGPLLSVLAAVLVVWLTPERASLKYGGLVVALALLARYTRADQLNKAAWALVLAYFPLLMLPGFFLPPLLQADPMWLEWHYGATVGVGEQLAAGMHLYGDIRHHYGVLLSMASGMVEQHIAALDAGQYYRVLQGLNLAFALLAALAYWRWGRGKVLKVLVPLALVLPFIHSLHLCLNFPNHSAWRFIGLPVVALLLLGLRRVPEDRLALRVGAIAATALLFNLETGIALSFGLVVFLIARVGPAPLLRWPRSTLQFAIGFLLVTLCVLLLYRIGLGDWPLPHSLRESLGLISSFSEGFGGYPLNGNPLALVIFLHAAYVVVYGALRWRFGGLSFRTAFRMAVAAALLIWFAYYVNRPIAWYLWSFLFLYGFLLADFVDTRLLRWNWAAVRRLKLPISTLVLAFVLIPAGGQANREALPPSAKAARALLGELRIAAKTAAKCAFFKSTPETGGCIPHSVALPSSGLLSGIPISPELATLIEDKARYLEAQPDRRELVYFTINTYFVPRLTGLYGRLGSRDVFSDTITNPQMDDLVTKVLALAPPRILFDAPDSAVFATPSTEYQRRFFARLRARLEPAYRPAGTEHGWLILERAGG